MRLEVEPFGLERLEGFLVGGGGGEQLGLVGLVVVGGAEGEGVAD